MARKLYNNALGTLGASLTSGGTTITFGSVPAFATLGTNEYIPLVLDPPATSTPGGSFEVVHLTSYTSGAGTGTIARGQEGTSGTSHANGATWMCAPVVVDASAGAGVSVLEYGAKGDGTTDDSTAINNAMNAANTVGAANSTPVNVMFPAGRKFFVSQLTAPNYVRLWAYGATILLNQASMRANGALLNCASNPPTGIEICGGTWVGTGIEQGNQQLFAVSASSGCQDILIRDMYITGWGAGPIALNDPSGLRMENNTLINPGLSNLDSQNSLCVNFVSTTVNPTGEVIIRGNRVENSASAGIAIVSTSTTQNGPKKIDIGDNITTGGTLNVTFSATNGSTAVTGVVFPNGSAPQLGSQFRVAGTLAGVTFGEALTMSGVTSGAGTLGSSFTGTTGSKTVAMARDDAGCIVWEFDAAATQTECIIHHNNVTSACTGNDKAIQVGANFSPVPGQMIIDSNITQKAAGTQDNHIRIYSTANPADVQVTNNRCVAANTIPSGGNGIYPIAAGGGQAPPAYARGNRISPGASQGVAVLVTGTKTVSTGEVGMGGGNSTDNITLTRVVAGGTLGHLSVGTIVSGTSFVINSSSATDTSTIFWEIAH